MGGRCGGGGGLPISIIALAFSAAAAAAIKLLFSASDVNIMGVGAARKRNADGSMTPGCPIGDGM